MKKSIPKKFYISAPLYRFELIINVCEALEKKIISASSIFKKLPVSNKIILMLKKKKIERNVKRILSCVAKKHFLQALYYVFMISKRLNGPEI